MNLPSFHRLAAIAALLLGACRPESRSFVYVSLDGEPRLAAYRADDQTGDLTRTVDTELASPPGALAASPDRRFLFVSLRSRGRLASFRIDPVSGALSHLSTVDGGADPAFLATDRTGRYLLTAYYRAGQVTVHRIGDDGELDPEPVQTVLTAARAHGILTDPTNCHVFVPHTGPKAIYQFDFDQRSGKLTPSTPPRIETGVHTGPRHLVFHPELDLAYVSYEQGSAVASFELDRRAGGLRFRNRLSTLPDAYPEPNSNSHIEITPDGRFVYVGNRGHDSLAGYAVDPATGRLRSLGQTPTEATPRGFGIDAAGRHLYAAGQRSGKLAAFRIDPETGALTRFATYEVGDRPWWVLAVTVGSGLGR